MSPPLDHLRYGLIPLLFPPGRLDVVVERRGFYPKGGGIVEVRTHPPGASPSPVRLTEPAPVSAVHVYSVASAALMAQRVAERQVEGVQETLGPALRPFVRTAVEYVETWSIGTVVTVVAELANGARIVGDALGERGKAAERVGREAAAQVKDALEAGAPVDEHMADQLVPYLALRGGALRTWRVSGHARTNCWLVEAFLGPRFEIDERAGVIRATAAGLKDGRMPL